MADYPAFSPGAHPTYGGKSIDKLPANPYAAPPAEVRDRTQRYKSWRKKYRKMRAHFDGVLEENKRLFKEEHKLESLAKRSRQELDGLLDVCLDLNENPSLPADLRFNIRPPPRHPPVVDVAPDISPEQANEMVMAYKAAVQQGSLPPVDLEIIRNEVEHRLAAQDSQPLDDLIASIPARPVLGPDTLGQELRSEDAPGYFTPAEEADYLLKLDARLGTDAFTNIRRTSDQQALNEDKHFAEMTPRELEYHVELLNPQSQHSWLKARQKLGILPGTIAVEIGGDDNDSLASHEPKPPRKRAGNKNLAKQVGDRAVERARDGGSPVAGATASAAHNGGGGGKDEDELQLGDGRAGKKKPKEVDNAYHPKGGKKTKRKRSGEDVNGAAGSAGGGGGGSKKPKTDGGAGSAAVPGLPE
ncbi:hypothetical protein LTR91_001663 [Friedmanniomyces endolithicus]|uniref:IEC3 subunit of the Ino80 complex, chromatin re-modelling-domain-containing protein n=1 Tax=Friedmanniomyces endolithicus TaxID=329885 RepID=A0AAN6KZV7_9PEZI|nr:hypothetical protein LTR35_003838 [Friedmanniomyces endolithicus]KAK0300344.1 hypothetical protein LTS00_001416 [Friedmanniomyces endolithicus]KAK0938986.1 hypothetical protein LTR29_009476 [Friedmanniomyces endolithicus]KAK1012420.1 hypothetical protein LTR91_001663 [Friedmanniomyces endolithicus]KAK1054009.1 hypothetical protein LTS16_001040 [Friedmanniomyces endolithicus]